MGWQCSAGTSSEARVRWAASAGRELAVLGLWARAAPSWDFGPEPLRPLSSVPVRGAPGNYKSQSALRSTHAPIATPGESRLELESRSPGQSCSALASLGLSQTLYQRSFSQLLGIQGDPNLALGLPRVGRTDHCTPAAWVLL